MKSQLINSLTGELHSLLAKEDDILDKFIDQIIHRAQDVEEETAVSVKVSAVNSQPRVNYSQTSYGSEETVSRIGLIPDDICR